MVELCLLLIVALCCVYFYPLGEPGPRDCPRCGLPVTPDEPHHHKE